MWDNICGAKIKTTVVLEYSKFLRFATKTRWCWPRRWKEEEILSIILINVPCIFIIL